jgi:hypothetical protein
VVEVTKCGIFSAQLSTMFDHKPVFISFKDISTQQFLTKKKVVTNWFLDEPLVKMAAELAALQVFSNSINNMAHAETVNNLRLSINILTAKILDCLIGEVDF